MGNKEVILGNTSRSMTARSLSFGVSGIYPAITWLRAEQVTPDWLVSDSISARAKAVIKYRCGDGEA